MKIRHFRLRNVKSYGEGPDGNGVVVRLQPGLNRIAGRNGHGKSTLIEALGYALFLADPVHEETFQAQTYLLRAGAKTGEIEVGFEHRGEAYRVIRPLGTRHPARDKVVSEADGSLAAEGRAEVDAFLCRLFGVQGPERLQELFGKLLGVKQGRLAWPFDSKPAEARRHFEPLLDVDVFRACFDRLKPVSDRFAELGRDLELRLQGVTERIRERAESPAALARCQEELARTEADLEAARNREAAARATCATWETRERTLRTAEKAKTDAESARSMAEQRHAAAVRAAEEARAAKATLATHAVAFAAYEAAEKALVVLQARQREKERLEKERTTLAAERLEWLGRRDAAGQQATLLAEQARERRATAETRLREAEGVDAGLESGRESHVRAKSRWEAARESAGRWRQAGEELARRAGPERREADALARELEVLRAWDPTRHAAARERATRAREAWESANTNLAAARREQETLARQVKEIAGGHCPFLREPCRQFDASRAGRDLESVGAKVESLDVARAEAEREFREAEAARDALDREAARMTSLRDAVRQRCAAWFASGTTGPGDELRLAWAALSDCLGDAMPLEPGAHPDSRESTGTSGGSPTSRETAAPAWDGDAVPDGLGACIVRELTARDAWRRDVGAFVEALKQPLADAGRRWEEADAERTRAGQRARSARDQAKDLERDAATLTVRAEEEARRGTVAQGEVTRRETRLEALQAPLAALAGVGAEIEQEQSRKRSFESGHRAYLGARDLAASYEKREAEVVAEEAAWARAREAATVAGEAWQAAAAGFDAVALAAARQEVAEAVGRVRALEATWTAQGTARDRERRRVEEWEAARGEEARMREEQGRWESARRLSEGARRLLKDAAPRVAQRLCDRLAARAQRLFHHLHPEPVELAWNAEMYSLRIEPGERRFAMLSGGEQTKLALALTLAMIREFSDLRFCIFDEPTYGVDADSRPRLAEAIVEAQAAAEFEQILVVSHDEAFEGRIENVVLLKKTGAEGTRVVEDA